MKIATITVCKNEAHIMPFFLRYYGNIADEMIFFDNGSTDGTLELIQKTPNTHIIPFNTQGYQREEIVTFIRNNAYKELQLEADWYIMADADEIVYHQDLRAYLSRCSEKGIQLPRVAGFNMFSSSYPKDDGHSQIFDLCNKGRADPYFDKFAVVRAGTDVNYGYGAHTAYPRGDVSYSDTMELKLLHFNANGMALDKLPLHKMWEKRNKKFFWMSNDIIKRNPGGVTRETRVWEQDESERYAIPVLKDDFNAFLKQQIELASKDDADALYTIAVINLYGHNVELSTERAMPLFHKAAELGHKHAQYQLGHEYTHDNNIKNCEKTGLIWYLKAAEQGHPHAQFEASLLLKKLGQTDESHSLLLKAAENNVHDAAFELSMLYENKKSKYFDKEKADHWRTKAATTSTVCMYNNGIHCYNRGEHKNALKWAQLAANRGLKDAYKLIDMILDNKLYIPKDKDQAEEQFKLHLHRKIMDYYALD